MPAAYRFRMPSAARNATPEDSKFHIATASLSNHEPRRHDDARKTHSALFSIAEAAVCDILGTARRPYPGARCAPVGKKAVHSRISWERTSGEARLKQSEAIGGEGFDPLFRQSLPPHHRHRTATTT
jgi:hypothetical protein